MLHHLLPRLRVRSAKIRVQTCPSHALMLAKSSSQTHLANAPPIGSNKDSGDRQSRIVCSSKRGPSLSRRFATRLNISSRIEEGVQGTQLVDRRRRERPAHVLAHEAPEPLA